MGALRDPGAAVNGDEPSIGVVCLLDDIAKVVVARPGYLRFRYTGERTHYLVNNALKVAPYPESHHER